MRSQRACLILGLCALSLGLAAPRARAAEPLDGKALYLAQCSNCHGVLQAGGQGGLPSGPVVPASTRLAVALPFGPSLVGVLGRQAGTVPGYQYSRAFLGTLRGMVWTRTTLDRWITDTRDWVPGAIMVYRQPDPAIRARIIEYLEQTAPGPASGRTVPPAGGEIGRDRRMLSSATRW